MFKLMDKKTIAILRKLFLLNWPYDNIKWALMLDPLLFVALLEKIKAMGPKMGLKMHINNASNR